MFSVGLQPIKHPVFMVLGQLLRSKWTYLLEPNVSVGWRTHQSRKSARKQYHQYHRQHHFCLELLWTLCRQNRSHLLTLHLRWTNLRFNKRLVMNSIQVSTLCINLLDRSHGPPSICSSRKLLKIIRISMKSMKMATGYIYQFTEIIKYSEFHAECMDQQVALSVIFNTPMMISILSISV